ncbi:hypothetical protein OWR29_28145 [Actinoplanes sp. Pm04-4]|uniref:Uncharacterized protein n=1 Tax=Paractinoplanes pyxinae TaxID=2997416 RepID=A0ABT4B8D5_9ACTN|nr:hypothetical protein [Actinoplanes pyxinae]MCY1141883.1 hypothetical protein [Actinoplanes pyxinae]
MRAVIFGYFGTLTDPGAQESGHGGPLGDPVCALAMVAAERRA